jgi:diaminohydroxyphosphoribosylaminopyrimidine deaminase / 5-amino-6-(5-phosphoribosylamino)uracil reductase
LAIAEGAGAPRPDDVAQMRTALALAARGLGRVWPNPAVGCLVVRDGRIVGRGWTQPGGRPHAETQALGRAGDLARGATAYVTLEPCDHQGVTAPCSDALIAAGISRAVIAAGDPDPRVDGRGIARLRAAGIAVATGVCAEAAEELNLGFMLRVTRRRPMITLKLATSLDGRIATAGGDARWITGEAARAEAHLLRARHDAILIGSGTALADDPDLTCRLPGMAAWSPVRVIADSRLRLSPGARVVRDAGRTPTWLLTTAAAAAEARCGALRDAGVVVIGLEADAAGRLDAGAVAGELAERGLTRVLLEGGGEMAASFLARSLVDRLAWFHAPRVIGAEGRPAAGALAVARIADAPAFALRRSRAIGPDILADYISVD